MSRTKLILDNDFGGDPDGLFQLAHHLLSPSAEILGIVNSHVAPNDPNWPTNGDSIAKGIADLEPVMELTGAKYPIFGGLHEDRIQHNSPVLDDTLDFLISAVEASDSTLIYACGGPMTQLARLLSAKPKNSENLRVLWIGGAEYSGIFPPGGGWMEYNLAADPESVARVFSEPGLELWQVPRDSYRRATVSRREIEMRLAGRNPLSDYLLDSINQVFSRASANGYDMGETYCLGDSPLVLLSVLENPFEPTPANSESEVIARKTIALSGEYQSTPDGGLGQTRVFSRLDTRLMFEDMFAKLGVSKTALEH